jgi:hypothetical protein
MDLREGCLVIALLTSTALVGCRAADDGATAEVTTRGRFEVTSELLEIPERFEVLSRFNYDYALVMKYRVIEVHRGDLAAGTIYVGHYNPLKPRGAVADGRVGDVGGNLDSFRVGDTHRMALDAPIEDHCMAGIINKYFDQGVGPIYWGLWTNRVVK